MENHRSPRKEAGHLKIHFSELQVKVIATAILVAIFTVKTVNVNNDAIALSFAEISTEVETEVETEAETEETIETEEISLIIEDEPCYKEIDEIAEEISPEMDISEPSGISKEDFVLAMQNCEYDTNNVLADNAELIWDNCNERQINEFAIVGIIAIESGWADPENSELAAQKRNIMSIKNDHGDYKTYASYSDCILDAIRILDENYLERDGRYATGGNLQDISHVYAEDENWANGVAECAEMSTRGLQTDNIW